ncbi:hypothetical protein K435DRAFT_973129 [Dendrothele bispora CBS 962.96]|uniref:Uncharacterized protein n=1 Tax=Dendrothele bispora (strain CBS 962.96) TaxID=1314807 RepID=A0A4S8KUU7_DENBC|nr:hypothetical protein K435DRAFT_973129 [Dendrothele bispora CBS 962.96]
MIFSSEPVLYTVVIGIILRPYYPFTDWSISYLTRKMLKGSTCFLVKAGGVIGVGYLTLIPLAVTYVLLTQITFYVVACYDFSPTIKAKVEGYRAGEQAFLDKNRDDTPKRLNSNIGILIRFIISASLLINDALFNRAEGKTIVDSLKIVAAHDLLIFVILLLVEILACLACFQVCDMIEARRVSREQNRLQSDEELKIGVSKQEPMLERKSEQELIDIGDDVKVNKS